MEVDPVPPNVRVFVLTLAPSSLLVSGRRTNVDHSFCRINRNIRHECNPWYFASKLPVGNKNRLNPKSSKANKKAKRKTESVSIAN